MLAVSDPVTSGLIQLDPVLAFIVPAMLMFDPDDIRIILAVHKYLSRRCIITCFIESAICHVDHPISTEWSPSKSTIFLIGMDEIFCIPSGVTWLIRNSFQKRTSTDVLRRKFERYGEIGDAYIPRDRSTGGKT